MSFHSETVSGFCLTYHLSDGTKIWIITEDDRSATTILLPEEYRAKARESLKASLAMSWLLFVCFPPSRPFYDRLKLTVQYTHGGMLNRISRSPFFGYALAVLGNAVAVGLTLLLAHFTRPGGEIGFLYLIAILAAAWTGYGPGLVACGITFVLLPYLFWPHFSLARIEGGRFSLTVLTALLTSTVAVSRKRVERLLKESNQQLQTGMTQQRAELQQTKLRLANTLDNITQGFFALDRNWCFLYANESFAGSAGLRPADLVGKNIWDVFPEAREDAYEYYRRVLDDRVPVEFEIGSGARWFDIHVNPTEEGLTAYVVEITERHQIQEKLIAAHERLMNVLESISDAFVTLDRQWHFLFVNQPAARLMRRPAEQIIAHTVWELFPQVVDTTAYTELQRAMKERVVVQFEMNYGGPAGIWVEHRAYPTSEGLALFSSDITARRKIEHSLMRLGNIVESSADAIVMQDFDGTITEWNEAAERIYGYSRAEVIGQNITILLPPDRGDEERQIVSQFRRGGRRQQLETTRLRKDGNAIHVSLTISPVYDSRGTPLGISHIARDISERLQFEEHLRQTQKLESLGVLAGGVAHDFNNLLTGILGNSSLVLESIDPSSPNHGALEEVVTAAQRAADLTRQLLAYAGKGRFVIRLVNVSELVKQITRLVGASIPKNVQVRLQLADMLPAIEADVAQIQQVVMNLVINGAEAIGHQPGTVLIQTSAQNVDQHYIDTLSVPNQLLHPGEYVSLEVHDTGCGMDDETKGKIFDPFFTTKFTGRGLGLSAVLGIVRGHKGALKVYSTPGRGSTFKLLFPAAAGTVLASQEANVRQEFRGKGVVLVVDDEITVRTAAKLALESRGYTVLLAENGQQAIELFRQRAGDVRLVLLDLTMPIMTGEETLRHLKMINPDVRVILSSGFNEVEAIQRFTGKGLAGFLQKPYTAAALGERVRSALDSCTKSSTRGDQN